MSDAHDSKKIKDVEFQIYNKWFNEFQRDFPEENIIYIQTDPETAYERVGLRNREGETIPLEYLTECHNYHEQWINCFPRSNVLVLNGNQDINKQPTVMTHGIYKLNNSLLEKCCINTDVVVEEV